MRDLTELDIEVIRINEHDRLLRWLIDNNIIRKSALDWEGYVAIDCYSAKPFTFQQLGEPNGNN